MKNADYTCDRCGAQLYEDETYSVVIKSMVQQYSGATMQMKRELCESCACTVMEQLRESLDFGERGAK